MLKFMVKLEKRFHQTFFLLKSKSFNEKTKEDIENIRRFEMQHFNEEYYMTPNIFSVQTFEIPLSKSFPMGNMVILDLSLGAV